MSHSYKVKERKQKWEDKVKNDIRMQCPFCLDLKLKYSISKHLLEMHYNEKDNPIYQDIMKKSLENKMICSECGKGFLIRQAYYHHLYKEHKDVFGKDFLCNTCGEGFITKSSLNTHIEKLHYDPQICVECNKTYPTKSSFKSHLKNSHNAELIECKKCDKKLNPKSMSFHIKMVHIKDKTNQCSECPRAFVLNDQLKKHVQQVHQGLRPYGCDKCTYKASSLSNLNLHRKKMHEISYNLSKAEFIEMIQNGNHPYCDSRFLAMINESAI